MKRRGTRFLTALLALAVSYTAAAQSTTSIGGIVKDPQGKAVAGAAVTLFLRDGAILSRTTADQGGSYHFDLLSAGDYIIQAESPGFDRFVSADVHVDRNAKKVDFNIALQLAGLQQSVVVTASSTPQTYGELSKAITVIDHQEIDRRDDFSVPEVLRTSPGLRVHQFDGPGGFTGIRFRGLRNHDTAVLVDGLRLRDASSTQADASGLLSDLLVTNIDRIEILRGSGSSLYGTNAIGGVVNIITDQGGGRARGSVLLEGGSLGLFRGRTQLAGGWKDNRVQYSAGLTHLNVTNGIDGDSPARNSSGQGRISIRMSPGTQLIARFYGGDTFAKLKSSPTSVGVLPSSGVVDAIPLPASQRRRYESGTPKSRLAAGNANFIPSSDDPDNSRAGRFLSGAMILSGHPAPSLGYSISYQGLATNPIFRNGPAGAGFQPEGSTSSEFNGRIHTLNARLDYQLIPANLVSGGYEFEDEHFETAFLDRLSPGANSSADVTQRSHSLFLQDQQRLLGDRIQVSGAFRMQQFSLRRPLFSPVAASPYRDARIAPPPTAYTGDGSIAYSIRQSGAKLRAHIGRGYRSPSLFERFGAGFDPDFGYSVYGDPRLQPERSTAFDAGIDQSFLHERVRTSATYFYTRLQDVIEFNFSGAIDPITDPFGRFGGYRNTKGGLARGVEFSSIISASKSLDISAAYTFTNAIERTPVVGGILRSFLAPDHQFSAAVTEHFSKRMFVNVTFVASSNYLAPIFAGTTRAYRFEGVKKAGVAFSYRVPLAEFKAIRFFAKVDNAFNQTYFESGFRTAGATGVSGMQFEF